MHGGMWWPRAQRHARGGARRVTITAIVVDAILAGGVVARAWSGYLAVLVRACHTPQSRLGIRAWRAAWSRAPGAATWRCCARVPGSRRVG